MTVANKLMSFTVDRAIGDGTSRRNVHNLRSTYFFVGHHLKAIQSYLVEISAFCINYLSAERYLIVPLVTVEQ